jgi:uncharacterized protein YebE (UPF0316 family)
MPEGLAVAATALGIFALRVVGVALGTVRVLLTNRGLELWSAVLGFAEVLVYVVAIGAVVRDLTDWPALLAYCSGFSVGTIVGIRIERRLAVGYVNVRAVSPRRAREVAAALRAEGFGATLSWGEGRDGRVGIVHTLAPRKHAARVTALVQQVDPDAFLVVDEARAVARGWLPGAAAEGPPAPQAAGPPSSPATSRRRSAESASTSEAERAE